MTSRSTAVLAAHETGDEFRIPPPRFGYAVLVMSWFRSQFVSQASATGSVLPDDARKQLQHDRLLAQGRLQIRFPL
jgi:hypothetical protein